jgi:hypothetical protein
MTSSITSAYHVLILAHDRLLAALLGTLVETHQLRPAFQRESESAEAALERVKPIAAVLIDAALAGAATDLFVARVKRRGAMVVLFGAEGELSDHREWATSAQVPTIVLPIELPALMTALASARQGNGRPRRSDRRAQVAHAADGTLVFEDESGTRWSVYDRRSAERRRVVDRRFVSDSGEVRLVEVTLDEARQESVGALAAQLARSVSASAEG